MYITTVDMIRDLQQLGPGVTSL